MTMTVLAPRITDFSVDENAVLETGTPILVRVIFEPFGENGIEKVEIDQDDGNGWQSFTEDLEEGMLEAFLQWSVPGTYTVKARISFIQANEEEWVSEETTLGIQIQGISYSGTITAPQGSFGDEVLFEVTEILYDGSNEVLVPALYGADVIFKAVVSGSITMNVNTSNPPSSWAEYAIDAAISIGRLKVVAQTWINVVKGELPDEVIVRCANRLWVTWAKTYASGVTVYTVEHPVYPYPPGTVFPEGETVSHTFNFSVPVEYTSDHYIKSTLFEDTTYPDYTSNKLGIDEWQEPGGGRTTHFLYTKNGVLSGNSTANIGIEFEHLIPVG